MVQQLGLVWEYSNMTDCLFCCVLNPSHRLTEFEHVYKLHMKNTQLEGAVYTTVPKCEESEKEMEELLAAGKNCIQLQLVMNQFQNYLKKQSVSITCLEKHLVVSFKV